MFVVRVVVVVVGVAVATAAVVVVRMAVAVTNNCHHSQQDGDRQQNAAQTNQEPTIDQHLPFSSFLFCTLLSLSLLLPLFLWLGSVKTNRSQIKIWI